MTLIKNNLMLLALVAVGLFFFMRNRQGQTEPKGYDIGGKPVGQIIAEDFDTILADSLGLSLDDFETASSQIASGGYDATDFYWQQRVNNPQQYNDFYDPLASLEQDLYAEFQIGGG